MRFGIIVFPGSNCDRDCWYVVTQGLGQDARFVWHQETDISDIDAVMLPGGFSYGDYLRVGAIARFSPVMNAVRRFAEDGGLVIGICNGFQILVEAQMLPGAFLRNAGLRFRCRPTFIRVENNATPFTVLCRPGQVLQIPIAHADGRYYADEATLNQLEKEGRIVFRYCDPSGQVTESANPNGSARNIAGLINETGNVLGMMPHPERASSKLLGSEDGLWIWKSLIHSFQTCGSVVPR
ncbi:MAG: phosphoribosylformylglycinamidine synthase subunit PurQ [Armatimonadetes bacterium]|nr:phosphoribosylformylglycinamidine synthase subunit PurQ [Armatimonadota bacterium]MDW8122558.1 phosphoribosylformylglycinamidine synthase subunit PurQ [Armatimonadota bacterium]